MIEVDTITGPNYWASYLVNGDASGLTAEEKAACDAWQASIAPWYVVSTGDDQEPRFTWHFRLYGGTADGGDVIDYIAHKVTL